MISYIVKIVFCLAYISVGIVNATAGSSKLPSGFIRCKLSDPSRDECIKNGLHSAYPQLAKGIPSLGLLPVDPMRINYLAVDQGVGAVKLKLKFKDLDIINMNSSILDVLTYDPKNYTFVINLSVKKPILLKGLYEANGKVLILPITGNGTCIMTLDDYKVVSVIQMKPTVRNDNTYLKIENLSWKFTTSKLQVKLNNLFNGDKVLGDNMNVFLNENWRELLNEMQPTFEEALRFAFISIAQQFFNRIPYDQIFIE